MNKFKWLCLETDHQWYRALMSAVKQMTKPKHYKDLYEHLNVPEGANNVYRLANSCHQLSQDFGHVMNIKNENHQILCDLPAILKFCSIFQRPAMGNFPTCHYQT